MCARINGRVVIKIGTSSIVNNENFASVDFYKIKKIVEPVAQLRQRGKDLILVASGAVAAGMEELQMKQRPKLLDELQAVAAVGQPLLIDAYRQLFQQESMYLAQILLTKDDIADTTRQNNIRHTIDQLLKNNIVPIINENDTVATEELTFGDNDKLAALVASTIDASKLYLFSDVDGLYDIPPNKQGLKSSAKLITRVDGVSKLDEVEKFIQIGADSGSLGTGGMRTKLQAARIAIEAGIECHIANTDKMHGVFFEETVHTQIFPIHDEVPHEV
ncbi:MAG: glutamate 5-kinase [Candidatus Ancillula sp.]|jgi:glutamate 5-kinase|nr:glutamate 5-kinase [Candidatus Ancillula sp.]